MRRKILFYSDHFGGPTTTFIFNDLIGLAQNHEVKYLCTSINKKTTFKYDNITIVPYTINPIRKKIRWKLEEKGLYLAFYSKQFSKKINEVINQFKPDIIQCQFGYEALRLLDNLTDENKNIPVVINFLGYDASFHLKRPSYVRKLKAASQRKNIYATCNTTFLKQNLEDKGINFQTNKVVYTGIRQNFFKRDPLAKSDTTKFIFLQIAVQSLRKGQEITIRAFSKFLKMIPNPEKYILHIAGGNDDDNYPQYLQKLVKELALQEKVFFTGWVTPDDAKELMQNANCFVHHSRTISGKTEGIPTAITEAMSMELPILATYHAGIPELVEDGVNGYLINENDIDEYAQKMTAIISWGLLPKNREKVIYRFSLENRINIFEEYYEQILKETK
ncbi:MAG: glycosyltransferase family 4 protein [Bacteroidia bacterium]